MQRVILVTVDEEEEELLLLLSEEEILVLQSPRDRITSGAIPRGLEAVCPRENRERAELPSDEPLLERVDATATQTEVHESED